jgi:hypothetical protein
MQERVLKPVARARNGPGLAHPPIDPAIAGPILDRAQ